MIKKIYIRLPIILLIIGLTGCNGGKKEYESCIQKGIQYYKDIDSYPKLKTENIPAEDKVRQLCKKSPVAFD